MLKAKCQSRETARCAPGNAERPIARDLWTFSTTNATKPHLAGPMEADRQAASSCADSSRSILLVMSLDDDVF